jgi:hypothetical protein
MAVGEFQGAPAFSIPTSPFAFIGAEGEMARVSIASLLEGAGTPTVSGPDVGSTNHITVGQHGMIADLYSSGSLSSVTLDFGLAVAPTPLVASGVTRHDVLDAMSGGNAHVSLADALHAGNDHAARLRWRVARSGRYSRAVRRSVGTGQFRWVARASLDR